MLQGKYAMTVSKHKLSPKRAREKEEKVSSRQGQIFDKIKYHISLPTAFLLSPASKRSTVINAKIREGPIRQMLAVLQPLSIQRACSKYRAVMLPQRHQSVRCDRSACAHLRPGIPKFLNICI